MIQALRRAYYNFRGFDEVGSTVPMMDGPLKPNTRLDTAPVLLALPGVDCLLATRRALLCASGAELLTLRLEPDGQRALAITSRETLSSAITCLTWDGDEAMAIGLDGQGVLLRGGRHDGRIINTLAGRPLLCPTAALFLDADTLLVANGAADLPAGEWKRDLMCRGSSGSVARIDLAQSGSATVLAERLAFPCGLARGGGGAVLVSEAWRHRLIAIGADQPGPPREVLGDLPAYPGHLSAAEDGGLWMALFAPRNQLVEFVLREPAYRRRMVETIDPAYWIAPALGSGASYLEPIQGGARKKLNIMKPWAPTWSCGLVVRCDAAAQPVASFHSRADGHVHGVTSVCEWGGRKLVAAKGSGMIVELAPQVAKTGRCA